VNGLEISVNGARLLADPSGALFWPDNAMLMVADLHLEKASSYAALGMPLPPYDSAETLKRLAEVIHRLAPETVICLGDSFHDATASERLNDTDVEALKALVADRDWVWITGNHDPAPPSGLGGQSANDLVIGPLRLCHEPGPAPATCIPRLGCAREAVRFPGAALPLTASA
jgi:DNA ligase-associated metallophosphoesterase